MTQKPPFDRVDLSADLLRPDLLAVGVVVVRPGRQETDTIWCEPETDPRPLFEMATKAGNPVAALLLVSEKDVTSYVDASWQRVPWFAQYVEHVTRQIHRQGIQGFLLSVIGRCAAVRN